MTVALCNSLQEAKLAVTILGMPPQQTTLFSQKGQAQHKPVVPSGLAQPGNQVGSSAINNPTELILQAAMEKINEMFTPYLGDGAVERTVDSGQDMSAEATAERILSFASRIISRVESEQADLPVEEQSSREQLFNNIKVGIEKGFEQARDILEGLQALNGETKETVDSTYDHVQAGLSNLALLLGLEPPEQAQA